MNQKDAERRVLLLWSEWLNRSVPGTYPEKSDFFMHLEEFHPELLSFRVRHGVDKWQVVQAWLSGK